MDLAAFVRHSPRDSALTRSMFPEAAEWTLAVQMLATLIDIGAAGNWQRGGGKGARPRPVKRPQQKRTVGKASLSVDEMDLVLGYSPRT